MPKQKQNQPFQPSSSETEHQARELNRTFSDMNRKFEEQATQRKALQLALPYFDLFGFPISQSALRVVSREEALKAQAIPIYKEKEEFKIGVVRPGSAAVKELLKNLRQKNFQPEIYLVSESGFKESIKQYKKVVTDNKVQSSDILVNASEGQVKKLESFAELGVKLTRMSATEVLSTIIGAGIFMRVSDIHLEPVADKVTIRFRVDGVLQDVSLFPGSVWKVVLSRLKLVSKMKLNVTGAPQEGRATVKTDGEKTIDLRISLLPTSFGESVVIRLLGLGEVSLQMESLGMSERNLETIKKELGRRSGMVLTTGPTGSGKTTSLYTFLRHLNEEGTKIITIEDPVEYQLDGIVQTPVDRKKGVDFASSLRAILRQDPEIIMVGEIRDLETAEIAAQAALTGHMVLSTMHTNDSSGAIPRFLNFGVKPVTLAPALNALVAQRLLRKLCERCKEAYEPDSKELERVRQTLSQIPEKAEVKVPERLVFYHSPGCSECHNLGYRGRIGIFEVFAVDEKIERLIYGQASSIDIKKAAIASGMLTLQQDAVFKALSGVTDLAEVWRVTEE